MCSHLLTPWGAQSCLPGSHISTLLSNLQYSLLFIWQSAGTAAYAWLSGPSLCSSLGSEREGDEFQSQVAMLTFQSLTDYFMLGNI